MELMPIRPQPGEIFLYLSLDEIENMTPLEALTLAVSLGFKPELRYRTWMVNGEQKAELCALLHYEKREFESSLDMDYLSVEKEVLATRIQPSMAVRFSYCLKYGREMEAAESVAA
jgi:hypothetical protein